MLSKEKRRRVNNNVNWDSDWQLRRQTPKLKVVFKKSTKLLFPTMGFIALNRQIHPAKENKYIYIFFLSYK